MSLLHILRSSDCDDALAVIRAQADAGVALCVVLEGDQPLPNGVTGYTLGNARNGVESIDNDRLVKLIFAANTVITW